MTMPFNRPAFWVALSYLILFYALIAFEAGFNQGWLFLLGGGLGAVLAWAAFGFTAHWRNFLIRRDAGGIKAQLVLIALTALIFYPLLGLAGKNGAAAPIGVSLIIGAFLFGIGMQWANGCGSGTLFTLGSGSQRMMVTIIFFIIGSVLGSLHLPSLLDLWSINPITVPIWATMLIITALYGVIHIYGAGNPDRRLIIAVILLATLNGAVLYFANHPWSVTFAFGLWGAKFLNAFGVDMAQFQFWQWQRPASALKASVLADTVSVLNFGLMGGAALMAIIKGTFATPQKLPFKAILGAALGGLLMGYGARLAFGCNVGAFLGGTASNSIHGWLWMVLAIGGSYMGIQCRPWFGLSK